MDGTRRKTRGKWRRTLFDSLEKLWELFQGQTRALKVIDIFNTTKMDISLSFPSSVILKANCTLEVPGMLSSIPTCCLPCVVIWAVIYIWAPDKVAGVKAWDKTQPFQSCQGLMKLIDLSPCAVDWGLLRRNYHLKGVIFQIWVRRSSARKTLTGAALKNLIRLTWYKQFWTNPHEDNTPRYHYLLYFLIPESKS